MLAYLARGGGRIQLELTARPHRFPKRLQAG